MSAVCSGRIAFYQFYIGSRFDDLQDPLGKGLWKIKVEIQDIFIFSAY